MQPYLGSSLSTPPVRAPQGGFLSGAAAAGGGGSPHQCVFEVGMQGQGGHFILGSRNRRAQQVNYFLLFFELSFPRLEAGIQRDPLNSTNCQHGPLPSAPLLLGKKCFSALVKVYRGLFNLF